MSIVTNRDGYVATIDFLPRNEVPSLAYCIVKRTFDISTGYCVPTEPEPLQGDIYDPDNHNKLIPGSDYWLTKRKVDVVFDGVATGPSPASERNVSASVGDKVVRVKVFGRRVIEWNTRGVPRIGAPEPFEEMAMTFKNAYGGVDSRVPVTDEASSGVEAVAMEMDHPGLYPRNPLGKGYVVDPTPVDNVELPNLEDPEDLLTDERLLVRDPTKWWLQPLPAALGWNHPIAFPRYVAVGAEAWFPVREPRLLAEVRRGWLPADYRVRYHGGPHQDFWQEAAPPLIFDAIKPRTPLAVHGMHPGGKTVGFRLPATPRIEFNLEGHRSTPPARLTTVVVRPHEEKVTLTYTCELWEMHRKFIPGIHGQIPLAIRVDDDAPIAYETPPPIRMRTQAADGEVA